MIEMRWDLGGSEISFRLLFHLSRSKPLKDWWVTPGPHSEADSTALIAGLSEWSVGRL